MLRRAIAFAATLLIAVPAMAQALWGQTRYGMTVDQVRAAVPEAVAPRDPGTLKDGLPERLRIASLEVANHEFKVSFFFDSARLTNVLMSPVKELSAHQSELLRDSLLTALRSKYGAELTNNTRRGSVMTSREADWSVAGTTISLTQIAIGRTGIVTVAYGVRVAKDAAKL